MVGAVASARCRASGDIRESLHLATTCCTSGEVSRARRRSRWRRRPSFTNYFLWNNSAPVNTRGAQASHHLQLLIGRCG
jgi:hypothetical protein